MATLGSLAELIDGEVIGDSTHDVNDIAELSKAGSLHLSFLANPRYQEQFRQTRAGGVLVSSPVENPPTNLIVCSDPYYSMARIATALHPEPSRPAGIETGAHVHPTAKVDPTAVIRFGATVDEHAVVGPRTCLEPGAHVGRGARIGEDCLLYPGARVLDRCVLGDRVILHAGVVIGSDGFGYAPDENGRRFKIPQVGIVSIGDDVEIGANTTVDRATFGATQILRGTKIDNLVQVGHNVTIGEDCVVVSQSGIAGSTRLGNKVIVGAQAGVNGHIEIADDVTLGARAGVTSSLKSRGVYSGMPAMPHRQWLKSLVTLPSLPQIKKAVRGLTLRMEALEKREHED